MVALASAASAPPGRDDAAMALHFILERNLAAAVEGVDDVARVCEVASRATIAFAADALPAALSECLRDAGVVVISFDDAVSAAPHPAVLSTRRGAARSLLDTAALLGAELDGDLALVADSRLQPALEPAIAAARSLGLRFATTVWLDGSAGPDVALGLAGDAIDHVVFATSTANQSSIATQLQTLSPSTRYTVLDAADSVVNQSTAPALDGARAVTSVLFPWHPGNDGLRAECRESWESAQSPPATLDNNELRRALLWCQHVRLAAEVASMLGQAGGQANSASAASSVTTALGPLPDGGFGPTRVTTATWSAGCACWTSEAGQ